MSAAPAEAEPPASTAAEVLTLEQAVRLALQHNRGLGRAALQVERAEQKLAAARTRRLPQLELQGMAGTTLTPLRISFPEGSFGTFPATGPIPSRDTLVEAPRSLSGNVNATLAQPLTQLHRIGLNTRLNAIARDIEREKLRDRRAALVSDVRRLYYGLLQAQSALRTREEQVRVYRELERVVTQQAAVEAALPADELEVKARLAAQEYELEALRGDLASNKESLNHLLGRALEHEFEVEDVPEATLEEADLPSALARALARRPDLAQARLAVEQADTDRRLKRAESIPELSLAVSYYSFVNVDLLPRSLAQAGLQLKWEPFDWGRRGRERAEKTLQLEQARSSAQDAEEGVRLEVARLFRKLREARLLAAAEALARDAADERARVALRRHAEQAALLKDALEAQAAASAAHTRYDQALLAFWTAKADFQRALGEEQ